MPLVGRAALSRAAGSGVTCITDVKRLIGRQQCEVEELAALLQYRVVAGDDGRAVIDIQQAGMVTPQQVSAAILKVRQSVNVHLTTNNVTSSGACKLCHCKVDDGKGVVQMLKRLLQQLYGFAQVLKQRAEDFTGSSTSDAVVAVPAHFSKAQRLATMEAAMQAGFARVSLLQVRYRMRQQPAFLFKAWAETADCPSPCCKLMQLILLQHCPCTRTKQMHCLYRTLTESCKLMPACRSPLQPPWRMDLAEDQRMSKQLSWSLTLEAAPLMSACCRALMASWRLWPQMATVRWGA